MAKPVDSQENMDMAYLVSMVTVNTGDERQTSAARRLSRDRGVGDVEQNWERRSEEDVA